MNIEIIRNTLYKVVPPPREQWGVDLQAGGPVIDVGCWDRVQLYQAPTLGAFPLTLAPVMGTRLHGTGSPSRGARGGPR